ncbi:unnamed protein product [Lactuca saligna]|uniref:Uncharacterized protein n=1 Tax=Lactuca saligna TaxID=75948 RepID=A0AA35VKA1_LACSI|nr:unnamed protein product [Lactuca saligna]
MCLIKNCSLNHHRCLSDPPLSDQAIKSMAHGADGVGVVESTVKGEKIIVLKQTIRDVLRFGDRPEFPIEISATQIREVLERMGYEGTFPITLKKLLPPYWRFIAHKFVICISGGKGGADEISQSSTGSIISLIMYLNFNFSRFVLNEMTSNLQWKKKVVFMMYPRFLQMIFDDKYPDLERIGEFLDLKSLGPNSFGLMKQNRKGSKVVPAVNPPVAIVAEKHMPFLDVDVDDDDKGEDNDEEGDASCFNDEDFMFKFEPNDDNIHSFFDFDEVNDVSLKASQPPLKRKQVDPRPRVLIREQTQPTQQPTLTNEPSQRARVESKILHEGHSFVHTSFEVGSSSAPEGSSAPQPAHDATYERLA